MPSAWTPWARAPRPEGPGRPSRGRSAAAQAVGRALIWVLLALLRVLVWILVFLFLVVFVAVLVAAASYAVLVYGPTA